jgi:hypothetical protein
MGTPTRDKIIEKALELWVRDQYRNGCPELAETTPEYNELLESGYISMAQSELMRSAENKNEEWNGFNERIADLQKTLEKEHDGSIFARAIRDIKQHLGLIVVAESGHGKSFTGFTLAKEAMKDPNMTVVILSPSTVWRRKFGKINCVKVGTPDFNPIIPIKRTSLEPVPFLRNTVHVNLDKKWSYLKTKWFEDLLRSKQHLLFEIKYKSGRRIKHFESEVLKFVYDMQEKAIERNPKYKHHYLIVLEEIQNSFGTYNMNSDSSLDLMTIFTQSRSDAFVHYIGICQRLADVSTHAVERLRPLIGLTLGENSLRKIRSQIPKRHRRRIQYLPKRHWIYLDGKENPEIVIPEYKRKGKPRMLKPKPRPKPETSKPEDPYILAMKKPKRSNLKAWLTVLKFLFWVDRGDLDKPNYKVKPARPTAEPKTNEDDLGAEHQLVADNENEESEALFW